MYNFLIKIKQNIIPLFICLFIILLLTFSKTNLVASKNGLILWATCIVPSLFPFFVAAELLNSTNIPTYIGKLFSKFMKPLFNVPGEGAYAFIMGIICGYPTGAKIVSNFYNTNVFTKSEAERLLAFTNNSGPLFIISTVGVSFFGNTEIGLLLLFTHLLSSIIVGILFGLISRYIDFKKFKSRNFTNLETKRIKKIYGINNLGELLSNGINSAVSTLFIIGGFVILFSVIISIFNATNISNYISNILGISNKYTDCILSGILELTNGLSLISSIVTKNISTNIIISAFILGFGGLCVLLQVFTVCSKNNLSIKWYFIGKILQGLFAAVITFIFLDIFTFISFDL